jgi:hypothetical protein
MCPGWPIFPGEGGGCGEKREGPRRSADLESGKAVFESLKLEYPSKLNRYSTFANAAFNPTISAPRSLPSVPLFL